MLVPAEDRPPIRLRKNVLMLEESPENDIAPDIYRYTENLLAAVPENEVKVPLIARGVIHTLSTIPAPKEVIPD
jgi:hypothetical protein